MDSGEIDFRYSMGEITRDYSSTVESKIIICFCGSRDNNIVLFAISCLRRGSVSDVRRRVRRDRKVLFTFLLYFYLVTWAKGSNLFEDSVSGGCKNDKPRVSRVCETRLAQLRIP